MFGKERVWKMGSGQDGQTGNDLRNSFDAYSFMVLRSRFALALTLPRVRNGIADGPKFIA
jgi:hypothetical protein